jgi:hypothetical protein
MQTVIFEALTSKLLSLEDVVIIVWTISVVGDVVAVLGVVVVIVVVVVVVVVVFVVVVVVVVVVIPDVLLLFSLHASLTLQTNKLHCLPLNVFGLV